MSAPYLLAFGLLAACASGDGPAAVTDPDEDDELGRALYCDIRSELLVPAGETRKDIHALDDPALVPADDPGLDYLDDDDRVIGVEVEGTWVAVPHNILWSHEIVNLSSLAIPLAVSYSPLTGSSIVFDRSFINDIEFDVSDVLLFNNLVMSERSGSEVNASLWPQMLRQARCGPQTGRLLEMYAAVEMRWGSWRTFHPDTWVVSGDTGHEHDYAMYPYGAYEELDNATTFYPQEPIDPRRPPKERVLGIPPTVYDGEILGGAVAFAFGLMDNGDPVRVIERRAAGRPVVVFWNAEAQAARAFRPNYGGSNVAFEVRDDAIVDLETGSEWSFDGVAVSGPLAGERLEVVPKAYVSFWFAWAAFVPSTDIW